MKHLLITLSITLVGSALAEAGHKTVRCKPTSEECCGTNQWYKAKDGTYREMIPYTEALSRAEDADNFEIALKGTREQLAAANVAVDVAKTEAEAARSTMEAQIAELTKQLDAGAQQLASEKNRADKAEAAHKLGIESVAQLRDEAKKSELNLASAKSELKSAAEEREAMKTANAELEKLVADLTAAKNEAEEAGKKAEQIVEKMKQEAAESKKAEVTEEPTPKDGDNPKTDIPDESAPKARQTGN